METKARNIEQIKELYISSPYFWIPISSDKN